jgi:hypothetical protein
MHLISTEKAALEFGDNEKQNIFPFALILKLVRKKAHKSSDEFSRRFKFIRVVRTGRRKCCQEPVFQLGRIEE